MTAAIDDLCRAEWGHLLSALIRSFGDFDLAEEALQEAFAEAVESWKDDPPKNPKGWLYTAARHNAIDQLRRRARNTSSVPELETPAAEFEGDDVPDDRLRLIFTCCHPALNLDAQVALTLRALCGLKTEEIARAFLVAEPAMAQRIVRAKGKIRAAAIPYRVPAIDELPERLDGVLSVIYLVFNEGYAATQGDALVRRELCAEAIRLARVLRALLPAPVAELDALLALMLLVDSRRAARVDRDGNLVLLEDQDQSLWDRAQIAEGQRLVLSVARRGPLESFGLEAAIAALHAERETDWQQIRALYARLLQLHPSPVVALNHAVAVAMAGGVEEGLELVEDLRGELETYHLWHATRADLLRRLERNDEARVSYERALELAQNEVEQRFLRGRINSLGPAASSL